MSSFANAFKGRTHKERSQPGYRKQHGLLEKKKDYQKRAQNFKQKKKRLQNLKRKAAFKNPDEFYFGMNSAQLEDGKHKIARKDGKVTKEEVKKMRDQDLKYLTLKETSEKKKVERITHNLHMIGLPSNNKHVVYVDTEEDALDFDAEDYFETPRELLVQKHLRLRKTQLKDLPILDESEESSSSSSSSSSSRLPSAKKLAKAKKRGYEELGQRMERQDKISKIRNKIAIKQAMAAGGKWKKVKGEPGKPKTYKRIKMARQK